MSIYEAFRYTLLVLIETSWNVKQKSVVLSYTGTCINRNIVECKEDKVWENNEEVFVLIETSWNVKEYGRYDDLMCLLY